ncbi:MAG: acyltransferase [Eubacteriales bacterium]|nr:acyltransferase [Eubacteriales bacterium]
MEQVSVKQNKQKYGAIDGLRTMACFGVAAMHVAANSSYEINGFLYEDVIGAFTNFVYLFMVISAFGMCCGYYDKMLGKNTNGIAQISFSSFYKKRFLKVLPFFACLCILDFVLAPSVNTAYEVFADLTLMFGLFPNAGNISVIGVGWFLGLIFVFYLLFPFFCVLIETKRRAWISFVLSLIYNYIGSVYFEVGRTNILYSACFFFAGGLIYLYRTEIVEWGRKAGWHRWLMLCAVWLSVVFYFGVNSIIYGCILVSVTLLAYAVAVSKNCDIDRGGVFENKFTKFISGISMEIYLCHMVMFRVVEKTGLNTMFGNGWMQYFITVLMVLTASVVFAVVMQKMIGWIEGRVLR